jgi:hypothetical protein
MAFLRGDVTHPLHRIAIENDHDHPLWFADPLLLVTNVMMSLGNRRLEILPAGCTSCALFLVNRSFTICLCSRSCFFLVTAELLNCLSTLSYPLLNFSSGSVSSMASSFAHLLMLNFLFISAVLYIAVLMYYIINYLPVHYTCVTLPYFTS